MHVRTTIGMLSILLAAPALAQVAVVKPGAVEAIGPKQDDPRTCDASAASKGIGGRATGVAMGTTTIGARQGPGGYNPETDPKASGAGTESIGPKQDDPRKGIVVQGGRQVLAIGPKQDDPRSPGVAKVDCYDPETDPQARQGSSGRTK